jgi:hypothetical protein
MLHHVSFNAHQPDVVAPVLSELLGAIMFRAPAPPFPANSWLVCFGDNHGSLIEVMPWGATRDPMAAGGTAQDCDMRQYSGTHLLAATPRSVQDILAIGAHAGWRAEPGSAGLFQFTKVWIENAFLIELMTPEQASAYAATFNACGLATLDHKLRKIERALSGAATTAELLGS